MEVLHHITPYFGGISPYIALTLVPEMAIDIYIYISADPGRRKGERARE